MFKGFSDATTDFLWGIRFNNEREWFLAHKQEYIDVLWTPFKELANEVYDAFTAKNPKLMMDLHISRIYRDARRLHGRGPYKDYLWFSMRQNNDDWMGKPVMQFGIEPEGYNFGMGVYYPRPDMMARFRRNIDENPREVMSLAKKLDKQSVFELRGDEYSRKKGDAAPPLDKWYNRKNIEFICSRGVDKTLNSPELVRELTEGFNFLVPYYKYFDRLAGMVD